MLVAHILILRLREKQVGRLYRIVRPASVPVEHRLRETRGYAPLGSFFPTLRPSSTLPVVSWSCHHPASRAKACWC